VVDGPRGPAGKVNPSIIRLAQLTGLPIVPFICYARSKWWFNSWDRFMGPLWSTPILYLFDEPVHVDPELREGEQLALASRLQEIMEGLNKQAKSFWQLN